MAVSTTGTPIPPPRALHATEPNGKQQNLAQRGSEGNEEQKTHEPIDTVRVPQAIIESEVHGYERQQHQARCLLSCSHNNIVLCIAAKAPKRF